MSEQTLTITVTPDGGYQVTENEDGAGEVIDQATTSPEEVLQLVQAFLTDNKRPAPLNAAESEQITGGEEQPAPPVQQMAQAWDAEAAMRDPQSGLRR